jgi:hypothetical protein
MIFSAFSGTIKHMTCFSIQKTLLFAALAGFLLCFAPMAGHAQEPSNPMKPDISEEIKKVEAEDQRKNDELIGKVDSPIVVELFTTADCTACVFADRVMYDTMKDKNVIALSCKINDLSELRTKFDKKPKQGEVEAEEEEEVKKQTGPMDPCVFRQWAYRSSRGSNDVRITIPTFVFNGNDMVIGDDLKYYTTTVNSYHYASKNKTLEVFMRWKDKDTITIHLPEDPKAKKVKKSASVWIVRYKDMMVEKVDAGLNKGRVLRFSNVIQDIKHIGKWHQQMRTVDIDVPAPQGGFERGGYVILVQEMMGEPVLAAGKLVDYPHPNDIKKKQEDIQKKEQQKKILNQQRAITPQAAPPATVPPKQ